MSQIEKYYIQAFRKQQEREVARFSDLVRNYQMLSAQYLKSQRELERLETENTQLKAGGGGALLKAQEKEIKNLRKETQALGDQLDEKQQLVKLTTDNMELIKEVARLEKKLENRNKEFEQLEEVMIHKEERLNEALSALKEKESQAASLGESKEKLDKKVEKLTIDNADLINRIIQMKQEVVNKMNEANEIYDQALSFRRNTVSSYEESKAINFQEEVEGAQDLNLNYFFKTPTSSLLPTTARSYISAHSGAINAVAFYPNGPYVATGGADKVVKIWSSDTNVTSEKKSLKGMIQPITSVSVSLDASKALLTSTQKSARIFNMKTCRPLETLSGHADIIHEGKICNSKPLAATGSGDRTVRVWDLHRGICKKTLLGLSSCNAIDVDCCDSMTAAGHLNGSVTVWHLDTGEKVGEFKGIHDEPLTSVRFTYDRNYLLTNSRDNTLKLLDMRKQGNVIEMQHELYTNGYIYNRASVSANDKYAVVGSSQGHILFFNLLDGKLQEVIENAHQCRVHSVHWQPRETVMASVDCYGGLIVWGT